MKSIKESIDLGKLSIEERCEINLELLQKTLNFCKDHHLKLISYNFHPTSHTATNDLTIVCSNKLFDELKYEILQDDRFFKSRDSIPYRTEIRVRKDGPIGRCRVEHYDQNSIAGLAGCLIIDLDSGRGFFRNKIFHDRIKEYIHKVYPEVKFNDGDWQMYDGYDVQSAVRQYI